MTETESDDAPFEPAAIRRRLPTALTDEQERALIAAIRNPDADVTAVADATAVEPKRVRHALDSVACGVLGGDSHNGEWVKDRGAVRDAETFAELTPKQAAVVDYLARTPSFEWAEQSSRNLLAAIQNADEGEAANAPEMHYTHPKTVAQKYETLIHERRAYLVTHEGLDLGGDGADVDDAGLRRGEFDSTRELLANAGYALPDENLDSFMDSGGRDVPPGRICESCMAELDGLLVCPECSDLRVYGGVPVEHHLPDDRETFDEDDVEKGVVYVGIVNGVEEYGIFVTVGNDSRDRSDVSGLMPERLVPDRVDLRDYAKGDEVRVVLNHREDAETEAGDRLFLGWPSENRVEGHRGETDETDASGDESAPAPEPAATTDADPSGDEHHADDRVAELCELVAEQSERLDKLERENERLREQVDEHAEALPSPEEVTALNDAAATVADAEAHLDAVTEKAETLAGRVEAVERDLSDQNEVLAGRVSSVEDRLNEVNEWLAGLFNGDDVPDEPPHTLAGILDDIEDLRERVRVVNRRADDDLAPIEAFENLNRRVDELEDETTDETDDLSDALETLREHGFEGEFSINL
jgi:hypothetical protein